MTVSISKKNILKEILILYILVCIIIHRGICIADAPHKCILKMYVIVVIW